MLLSIIVAYRNPTPNAGSPLRKLRIWCFYIGNAFCAWAKISFLKFIVETADINFCLSQEFVTAQDLYSSLWNQTKTPRYRSLSQWCVVRDPFQCECNVKIMKDKELPRFWHSSFWCQVDMKLENKSRACPLTLFARTPPWAAWAGARRHKRD